MSKKAKKVIIGKPVIFTIDSSNKKFKGYGVDEYWNGWSCPYFELAEAKRVAKACDGRYDKKTNTFIFDGESWDADEPETFESQILETVDGKKEVWAIGAWGWVWEEEESKK